MSVSILIPTYNRARFSNLLSYNIRIQDYTNIKEVIIADDGTQPLMLNIPYKIRYLKCKRMTIGEKRNYLIKHATGKYSAFMDDDDIYFETYLSHSIEVLERQDKTRVVGSSDMLFYFLEEKKTAKMMCSQIHLLHEATLVFDTKFVKHNMKFGNNSAGEGKDFLENFIPYVEETDIHLVMCCLGHSKNTVNKKPWLNYGNNPTIKIDNHLEVISNLIL